MIAREAVLRNLVVGDVFHAESPNGASLICLVTQVDEISIYARTVTTQVQYLFDRRTGLSGSNNDQVTCTIDSIEPLPVEVYSTILGIDRKFRLSCSPEKFKLNEAEKSALVFVDSFYMKNRL
ncbi:hypothetical protein [Trinickia dabaoshanensis]|uniref:hypothetical protein n=1 Tax=Trinickia dabaoshanensis TaxID=564714 RepID=UPI0011AECCE9|nr:hypothetical protein [Trinickia dabaoshanensis]